MRETTLCYIEKDGCYLFMHRSPKKKDGSAGKWQGVGGKFRRGETPEQCIRRETKEETGLTLKTLVLRGTIFFYSDTYEDERMYLFTSDSFEGTLMAGCDEGELSFVPFDRINNLPMWEGDRVFLKKLLEGEPYFCLTLTYQGDRLVSINEDKGEKK